MLHIHSCLGDPTIVPVRFDELSAFLALCKQTETQQNLRMPDDTISNCLYVNWSSLEPLINSDIKSQNESLINEYLNCLPFTNTLLMN